MFGSDTRRGEKTVDERERLRDWEHMLASQLQQVVLIGELELTREETQELARLIGRFVRWCRHPERGYNAEERLERKYPHAFVTFLVFQGRHGYDEGDYWTGVREAVGVEFRSSEWGQIFERTLQKLNLPRNFTGHRYVAAILGHGGIPTDCLPDFITHLLQPAYTRQEWAALDTPTLIQTWLSHSVLAQVDRPVRRFLSGGDRLAIDFIDRCRRMARLGAAGEDLDAAELGLPGDVVEKYQEWLEDQDAGSGSTGSRWRRPRLALALVRLGVHIWLPAQTLDPDRRAADIRWRVDDGGGRQQEVWTDVRPEGGVWRSAAQAVPLHAPAACYRVRAILNGEVACEWTVPGVDPTRSLLAFDAETGYILKGKRDLPGRVVCLLFPPESSLRFRGGQPDVGARPHLNWDWHTWQACEVDLAGLTALVLDVGETLHEWPIVPDARLNQLRLLGEALTELEDAKGPLFVSVPRLFLPGLASGSNGAHLARWRVELIGEPDASPHVQVRASLADLADLLEPDSEGLTLALGHPRLLGATSCGHYTLRVRGALGKAVELRFRVVPCLDIQGHIPLYIPDEHSGAPPVQLTLMTDAETRVALGHGAAGVRLEQELTPAAANYRLMVPPDRVAVPLRLIGRDAVVLVTVPMRRVRWWLVLHQDDLAAEGWADSAQPLDWAALDQSDEPALLVDLPGLGEEARVRLRLLEPDGTIILEVPAPRLGHRTWIRRFDLRQVRDTLRQSESPVVRAVLIVNAPDLSPIELPVLMVRRQLHPTAVSLDTRAADRREYVDLLWEPPFRLKRRQVRLWPLTRPWAAPLMVRLPDEARDFHTEALTAPLPAGRYRVEFTTYDPWLRETTAELPPADASNVHDVDLGHLTDRLADLTAIIATDPYNYPLRAERALLHKQLGKAELAADDVNWLYRHRQNAPLAQIVSVAHAFKDLPHGKALSISLCAVERVRSLVADQLAAQIPPAAWRAITQVWQGRRLATEAYAAMLALPTDDPQWRAAAAILMEQGHADALSAVSQAYATNTLDRDSALLLLGINQAAAIAYLTAHSTVPAYARLLADLRIAETNITPTDRIGIGHWVRTQAGWGQIEYIDKGGRSVNDIALADVYTDAWLLVVLRAGEQTERIRLDPEQGIVDFMRKTDVCVCAACRRFATRDLRALYDNHWVNAHGAKARYVTWVHPPLQQSDELVFSSTKPHDIWS